MSSLINIYSLPKKKTLKEDNRLKIYERVLKMCHHRIKIAANSTDTDESTFFTIPNMILGMPKFDPVSCCDYIMTKLTANGFKILNLTSNMIFITWAHIKFNPEKERKMQERISDLEHGTSKIPVLNTIHNGNSENDNENDHDSNDELNNMKNEIFRPIYDTPSTEKFLMT